MAGAGYRQRTHLLREPETFTLEGGDLVRRLGQGETRWPLAGLTRAGLTSHPAGHGARRLTLQLAFGRRGVALTSHSIGGVARLDDETPAFRDFARRLLDAALVAAPDARLVRSGSMNSATLWWAIAALGCGTLVVAASAMASGTSALGLDLSARLVFLALVVACALPWSGYGGEAKIDPAALLAD